MVCRPAAQFRLEPTTSGAPCQLHNLILAERKSLLGYCLACVLCCQCEEGILHDHVPDLSQTQRHKLRRFETGRRHANRAIFTARGEASQVGASGSTHLRP